MSDYHIGYIVGWILGAAFVYFIMKLVADCKKLTKEVTK